jgi:hypothetical protein
MVLQLIDEDAGIERNAAMTAKKGAQPGQSQLLRSF